MPPLTRQQKNAICLKIDNEGGTYECLNNYDNFEHFGDEEFNLLRETFLDLGKKIENYIGYDWWCDNIGIKPEADEYDFGD
jgi:hypothetical protein